MLWMCVNWMNFGHLGDIGLGLKRHLPMFGKNSHILPYLTESIPSNSWSINPNRFHCRRLFWRAAQKRKIIGPRWQSQQTRITGSFLFQWTEKGNLGHLGKFTDTCFAKKSTAFVVCSKTFGAAFSPSCCLNRKASKMAWNPLLVIFPSKCSSRKIRSFCHKVKLMAGFSGRQRPQGRQLFPLLRSAFPIVATHPPVLLEREREVSCFRTCCESRRSHKPILLLFFLILKYKQNNVNEHQRTRRHPPCV